MILQQTIRIDAVQFNPLNKQTIEEEYCELLDYLKRSDNRTTTKVSMQSHIMWA